MVLESVITPLKAEQHPKLLFINGFVYATAGYWLSWWIFNEYASLLMVFLTSMAVIPLIYNIIKLEEKKDLSNLGEKSLLKEHSKALNAFFYYFLGATLAFAFWYVVLPNSFIDNEFSAQIKTITYIRSNVTGMAYSRFQTFTEILANNLKVLIFCILFSFLYGLGAVFILTWNGSVIGVAIGNFIRSELYLISEKLHFGAVSNYFQVIAIGLFKYAIHGIPEIAAYLVAGLAGGIISSAVIRHDFGTKKYEKIILDSSVLLLLSLALVVAAAILEVWVTPVFF